MSRRATALLLAALAVSSGVLTALLLPRTEAPPPAPPASIPAAPVSRPSTSPLSAPRSTGPALTPEARALLLEEIEDLAVQYDARVLPRLQPLLGHNDPAIRAAAAQAIVTLGETTGAPLLREAALTAPTPEEAVRLKSQADYLELPSAVPDDTSGR